MDVWTLGMLMQARRTHVHQFFERNRCEPFETKTEFAQKAYKSRILSFEKLHIERE